MHVVLALSIIHDTNVYQSRDSRQAAALAYHWYHGTALFNAKLSSPLDPAERDALWAAAALLGTAAFADVQARTYREAWPLSEPSAADFGWLRMTDGKKAVFQIVDPLREDSVFRTMVGDASQDVRLSSAMCPEVEENLPRAMVELLDLDERSTPTSNPYHGAATILAQIMPFRCSRSTVVRFMAFISHLDPAYMRLLEARDDRALLLLSWWYAKVLTYDQWWICRRAILEGPAICVFLRGRHGTRGGDARVVELLAFPEAVFGMRAPGGTPANESRLAMS